MKLTALIILSVCLQVSARNLAQQRITLSQHNASLETVLQEIHDQTGYEYFFKAEDARKVKATINIKNTPVDEVLPMFFQEQAFTYEIVNKIIVITDAKGNFNLKRVNSDATAEISYTGYALKQVEIENQLSFKVSLGRATNKLDEVQVIAYGTTAQKLNTGDVTTVTVKEIEQQSVSNPLAALEDRVPEAGTMKVDFNVYSGVGNVTREAKLVNTQKYLQMNHEAFRNDGATPKINDYNFKGVWDTTKYTNWPKVLTGNTVRFIDAEASIFGCITNTQYLGPG